MLSGRKLDLLDPSWSDVEIQDVAHGLARVARWNGQTIGDHAFSVAQHSLLVLEVFVNEQPEAGQSTRLLALLHDAAEYVIGDMISPFKAAIGMDYKAIESKLSQAIHVRFGLPPELTAALKKQIKRADLIAAYLEATQLAGFSIDEAQRFFRAPTGASASICLEPWPAPVAQSRFLATFKNLSDPE